MEIPLIRKETQLQAFELKELEGRIVKYDLTRFLRGKSMLAQLNVVVKDDKAIAIPTKITLLPYFIRRMIRKRISYVEDSFETPSQESLLRIKPFLITRKKVSRRVRKALRIACKDFLVNYMKERNKDELFSEAISNYLQKTLSSKLKKIYPLALCEIRILSIE